MKTEIKKENLKKGDFVYGLLGAWANKFEVHSNDPKVKSVWVKQKNAIGDGFSINRMGYCSIHTTREDLIKEINSQIESLKMSLEDVDKL